MQYFQRFSSNTIAGSGNQHWFTMPAGEVRTARAFYKITAGGEYSYSLLFSNIIDSTFSKGDVSHKNLILDSWRIHSARIGKCKQMGTDKPLAAMRVGDEDTQADINVTELRPVTFNGSQEKTVAPGEFFATDPLTLSFAAGEFLCLELTFSGERLPYHHESMLPIYVKGEDEWRYDVRMPLPGMVGCDRPVKGRIAYFGDSITQGIGTPYNSYTHWNARLSTMLGDDYAHWNLGLGFGRAEDAASDSAWMYKAKQNDIVVVCFGVNDIFHSGQGAGQIKKSLATIVDCLLAAGVRVVLQTVPPFDYAEPHRTMWQEINAYIEAELASRVSLLFDNRAVLSRENAPYMAKHGGHPNAEGCAAWADALYQEIKALF